MITKKILNYQKVKTSSSVINMKITKLQIQSGLTNLKVKIQQSEIPKSKNIQILIYQWQTIAKTFKDLPEIPNFKS